MDTTSLTLLDQLRRPDQPDAWSRFTRLYLPLLRKWAKRQGLRDADADDLTQEIFVKLMSELPKYRREDGSFRGWLFRVTSRQCADFRRRVSTRPLPVADMFALTTCRPDTEFEDFEEAEYRRALVHRGLELIRTEFGGRTWSAFHRSVCLGHPVGEVARDLGVTENAVYLARHRVLARLRREIDGFVE